MPQQSPSFSLTARLYDGNFSHHEFKILFYGTAEQAHQSIPE